MSCPRMLFPKIFCQCETCVKRRDELSADRAQKAARLGQQQADAYYDLMKARGIAKAIYPESNIIPFPVHRTRGYGGVHESA